MTLRQQVDQLEQDLIGAHSILGVILAGVGGSMILSREQIAELGKMNPKIVAYVIEDTDGFLLRLVDNDGNPWTDGTTLSNDGRNEDATVA